MKGRGAVLSLVLLVIAAGGAKSQAHWVQSPALARECMTHRALGSSGKAGDARFAPDRMDDRFRPRSAMLSRRVMCGFRAGKLVSASEHIYLQIVSEDRENPGFTTGFPSLSARYYIVCEGGVGATFATLFDGQVLSFGDNSFTLPCGHMIYPVDVYDPAKADRITGVNTYKVRSAMLRVRKRPTLERPTFDLSVDVSVANPFETLDLRGRVSGRVAMAYTIVNCSTRPRNTKQAQHPACP